MSTDSQLEVFYAWELIWFSAFFCATKTKLLHGLQEIQQEILKYKSQLDDMQKRLRYTISILFIYQ